MFHCGELKPQPDSILTMITLHLGRCHTPLCCFYGPWASTHSQYCRQAIRLGALNHRYWRSCKIACQNQKQMSCPRANPRLFVVLFSPVSHFWQWWETGDFRESARNLRETGNCNKITITELTQSSISHKVNHKGKSLRKCLRFWQLGRTIYYIYSFLISIKEIMGIALLLLRTWIKVLAFSPVKYKVKQGLAYKLNLILRLKHVTFKTWIS